jgi:ABC-2 type transport system permease protein
MVSSLIADSVAGERERHTLETLLASRLSDSAILIGKIIAAVLYGVGFAVVNLVIGLVAVNVAHHENGLILFGAQRFFVTIVLTILASLLMAGIGVFISLRASTVKQAQQAFGIAIIVLTMGPLLLFNALSAETQESVTRRLSGVGETRIEAYAMAGLVVLSAVVIGAALARFKRGKLVLD